MLYDACHFLHIMIRFTKMTWHCYSTDYCRYTSWHDTVIPPTAVGIPINSNSVLLMRVASECQYECFEHVQNFCVLSANNYHSCLCAFKTYHLCHTAYVLYSSHSNCILCNLCMSHFRRTECECDSIDKKRTESSSYYFHAILESFENDSHCYLHC